ncbi:hypothetical protein ACVI1N_002407 [Sinorhizobium medicae]
MRLGRSLRGIACRTLGCRLGPHVLDIGAAICLFEHRLKQRKIGRRGCFRAPKRRRYVRRQGQAAERGSVRRHRAPPVGSYRHRNGDPLREAAVGQMLLQKQAFRHGQCCDKASQAPNEGASGLPLQGWKFEDERQIFDQPHQCVLGEDLFARKMAGQRIEDLPECLATLAGRQRTAQVLRRLLGRSDGCPDGVKGGQIGHDAASISPARLESVNHKR